MTELYKQVTRGNVRGVKECLEENETDVNCLDPDSVRTILHVSVDRGFTEITELLLLAGADINAEDHWGCTPLECTRNEIVNLNRRLEKQKELCYLLAEHREKE